MRYSHALRKYHSQSHRVLSAIILTASVSAIIGLIILAHANTATLVRGLSVSTLRVFLAYAVTLPLSLLIVIFITRKKAIEDFFVPILDVAQSLPSFAFLPVMIAIIGRGTPTIVAFLVLEMVWPIIFTTLSAVKTTREDLSEAATVFQAKGFNRLRYFILPSLFPSIITGSIVGWGEAWETIIGAELIAGRDGIGAFIGKSYDSGNTFVFAITVLILLLFVFILNRLIWLPLLKRSTIYQTE